MWVYESGGEDIYPIKSNNVSLMLYEHRLLFAFWKSNVRINFIWWAPHTHTLSLSLSLTLQRLIRHLTHRHLIRTERNVFFFQPFCWFIINLICAREWHAMHRHLPIKWTCNGKSECRMNQKNRAPHHWHFSFYDFIRKSILYRLLDVV